MAPAVLRVPRILSYMVTNALAIVGLGATLNGLIKARNYRDSLEAYAVSVSPFPDFSISIDINDVLTSGGFIAAGEILLALTAFFSWLCLIHPGLLRRTEHSRKTQTVALVSWVFALTWTLATGISTTVIGRRNKAKTKAWVSGVALPKDTVNALEEAAGINPHYWVLSYAKFLIIVAWPLILVATISTILTFKSFARTDFTAGHIEYPGAAAADVSERTSESTSDEKKASPV